MRSALWSDVGGVPDGTVTVGAFPAVPAGDRSAAGIGRMASSGLSPGTVVVVLVPEVALPIPLPEATVPVALPAGCDGEELQAARPSALAAPIRSATVRASGVRENMRRDGSRS